MIQRVQTLWMILAAIAVFLTIKFSFYSGTLALDNVYQTINGASNFYLLILISALGTGILINIFLYKQRSVQFRIVLAAILLECIILFLFVNETKKFSAGNFSLWSALHPLIILFLIFAARGIYKDSKLIKDSNRLR